MRSGVRQPKRQKTKELYQQKDLFRVLYIPFGSASQKTVLDGGSVIIAKRSTEAERAIRNFGSETTARSSKIGGDNVKYARIL